MMPDLSSLLSRLEAATEGSAELDRAIADHFDFPHTRYLNFTRSLDAALSLADPEWWLTMRHTWEDGNGTERECLAVFEFSADPYTFGARAPTFPLAICRAALRAREAQSHG